MWKHIGLAVTAALSVGTAGSAWTADLVPGRAARSSRAPGVHRRDAARTLACARTPGLTAAAKLPSARLSDRRPSASRPRAHSRAMTSMPQSTASVGARAKQPVARALRHDWLWSLAERHRWDWFLPRAGDVADPALICDRLEGRLETGDTKGLGADVLTRWNIPQKQPHECDASICLAASAGPRERGAGDHTHARRAGRPKPAAGTRVRHRRAPHLKSRPCCSGRSCWRHRQLALDALDRKHCQIGGAGCARGRLQSALTPRFRRRPGPAAPSARKARYDASSARAVCSATRLWVLPTSAIRQPLRHSMRSPRMPLTMKRSSGACARRCGPENYDRALSWIEQMPAGLAAQSRWRYWRARATAATRGD